MESLQGELCGDIDIRIARDGTWFYHGSPIGRKELVRLFSTVLQRDDDGVYWLVTPAEKGRITVEDVPFIAIEMTVVTEDGTPVIRLKTNVGDEFVLDGEHPLRVETDADTGEPSPYATVRDGLEARLARPVYYELVSHGTEEAVDGKTLYGVWSGDYFFPIGTLDETA